MKNLVVSLLILVVMIIAISISIKYLNKASSDLSMLNNEIEQHITADNWDEAYKTSIEFTNKWNEYSTKIKLFIDHQEMDNIDLELWKLPQYIKEMTKDESLASVHSLKFLLNHIAELEEIKLENIF